MQSAHLLHTNTLCAVEHPLPLQSIEIPQQNLSRCSSNAPAQTPTRRQWWRVRRSGECAQFGARLTSQFGVGCTSTTLLHCAGHQRRGIATNLMWLMPRVHLLELKCCARLIGVLRATWSCSRKLQTPARASRGYYSCARNARQDLVVRGQQADVGEKIEGMSMERRKAVGSSARDILRCRAACLTVRSASIHVCVADQDCSSVLHCRHAPRSAVHPCVGRTLSRCPVRLRGAPEKTCRGA